MKRYHCLDYAYTEFGVQLFLKDKVDYIDYNSINFRNQTESVDNLLIIDRLDNSADISNIIKKRNYLKKNTKVIFDRSFENGISDDDFINLYKKYKTSDLEDNNILYFLNTSCPVANDFKKIVYHIDLFAVSAFDKCILKNHPVSTLSLKSRPNKINLLLGTIDKNPRKQILEYFWNNHLVNHTLFGLLTSLDILEQQFSNKKLIKFLNGKIGTPDNVRVVNLAGKITSNGWSGNSMIYDNSSVSFIVETWMHRPFFLTEKTYRPIINRHPFILLGPSGSLKHLQKLGFQTFNSIIDETYDEIEDSEKRINLAVNSAKIFLQSIHLNSAKISELVEYNFINLLRYASKEFLETEKFLSKFLNEY